VEEANEAAAEEEGIAEATAGVEAEVVVVIVEEEGGENGGGMVGEGVEGEEDGVGMEEEGEGDRRRRSLCGTSSFLIRG
jgi:hypothetical protein